MLADMLRKQLSLAEELDELKSERHEYKSATQGLPSLYDTMQEVGGEAFDELKRKLDGIDQRIKEIERELEMLKIDMESSSRKDSHGIDDHGHAVGFSEQHDYSGIVSLPPKQGRRTARNKEQILKFWKDRIEWKKPRFADIYSVPQFMRACGDERVNRIKYKGKAKDIMGKWEYELLKTIVKEGGMK